MCKLDKFKKSQFIENPKMPKGGPKPVHFFSVTSKKAYSSWQNWKTHIFTSRHEKTMFLKKHEISCFFVFLGYFYSTQELAKTGPPSQKTGFGRFFRVFWEGQKGALFRPFLFDKISQSYPAVGVFLRVPKWQLLAKKVKNGKKRVFSTYFFERPLKMTAKVTAYFQNRLNFRPVFNMKKPCFSPA